jgi:hypothetical protein
MLPVALVCKTEGAIKNGQTRATGNIERKSKGQSQMDKPEQLATLLLWFSLYVASCSGLSIFDCSFGFLSMLPVALVCSFLIAPFVFSLCCQLQRSNQKWTNQSNWQHREKTKGAIKNGQTRSTGNIERKPKEQSKMDKPEQLAT